MLAYAGWLVFELLSDCHRLTDENARLRRLLNMLDEDRIETRDSLERSRRNLTV